MPMLNSYYSGLNTYHLILSTKKASNQNNLYFETIIFVTLLPNLNLVWK